MATTDVMPKHKLKSERLTLLFILLLILPLNNRGINSIVVVSIVVSTAILIVDKQWYQ